MSVVEECYRGSQVRVFRLNREAAIAALRDGARVLLAERPEVLEVRLFGSLRKGQAGPGSDADVLIILEGSAKSFIDRIPDYARYLSVSGLGCDVFPYTQAELARLRRERNAFAETAWSEGELLASRGAGSEPAP